MMSEVSNSEKTYFPKWLLIAGQQQNVGKTTLACRIISQFTWSHKITGVKITPHFHKNVGDGHIIEKTEQYQILKETTPDNKKDTSLMLRAGAEESFLLQVKTDYLQTGFNQLLKYIPEQNLVVCESASLQNIITPAVFLVLRQIYCKVNAIKDDSLLQKAGRIVTFTGNGFDFSTDEINAKSGEWKLANN